MSFLKKYPYFSFSLIMLFFGVLEAILTPILSFAADERLAITVPLGYFAQAIAVIAPFLMMGAASFALCEGGFSASLPFLAIYTGARVLMQFPLSVYEYSESLSSPYLLVLLVRVLTALLNATVFLLLLSLGYLLFARKTKRHDERFFGFGGTDTRILWLSVLIIAVQDLIVFAFDFIEHLKGKLWLFDGGDLADAFISLFFIVFCALLAFTSGRFASRAFFSPATSEDEA